MKKFVPKKRKLKYIEPVLFQAQSTGKCTVIRDTKEKDGHGWIFPESELCAGTIHESLKTGDYTLKEYRNILSIERKGSCIEWSQNILQERFYRELERLEKIKYAYIILEFTMEEMVTFPRNSNISWKIQQKMKLTGPFLLKKTLEMQQNYPNIKIIWAGNRGKEVASAIFKQIIAENSNETSNS